MAILAECDICGAQHRVKAALAGSCIRCRECGVTIGVWKSNLITPDTFFEEAGILHRRELAPKPEKRSWIVAGLVSGLIVLFLALVIWLFLVLVRLS
jgi:hypothetical protein